MALEEGNGFDYRSLLPARLQQSGNHNNEPSYFLIPGSGSATDDNGGNNNNNDNDDSCGCKGLSFRERMLGFGTCLIAGYMLSFGSFFRISALVMGNPRPLVIHAAMGNLLAWIGSFFLVGPKTQWKRVWEEKRKRATQVYLISLLLMVTILVFQPWGPNGLYLFVLIVIQNAAMTWYCLSYIPFAQETVAGWISRWCMYNNISSIPNDLDLSYMPAPV